MLSSVSPGSLILTLLIVVLLFGTKKLQTLGEDMGKALKGFRKGLKEIQDDNENPPKPSIEN